MSEVMMTVRDQQRALHNTLHGSDIDRLVAALSADPETLDELGEATARFQQRTPPSAFFHHWHNGVCDEPWDAGVCIIDLPARLVACRSTYSRPATQGSVEYHDGQCATTLLVRYCLAEDWMITSELEEWRSIAERRRKARPDRPTTPTREVLYGTLRRYLVDQCLSARHAGLDDPIVEIHKNWLLTNRQDLGGRAPRDVLLADMDHIEADVSHRAAQWSRLGKCPPGISTTAAAYQWGGIGVHEWILYYDLVRHLLEECWVHVQTRPNLSVDEVCSRLADLQRQWLESPHEELDGYAPGAVVELERRRVPFAVTGREAMVDDDCPLCQMMAEMDGPVFCHLDGSNMDDDFAFSRCLTRAEWSEQQEDFSAEFSRECDSWQTE